LTGVDPRRLSRPAVEPRVSLALVLAGGGTVGVAWELGVLIGLQAEDVDLSAADRIVGTSAGAIVGTLLGSGVPLGVSGVRLLGPAPDGPDEAIPVPDPALLADIDARWSDGPLGQPARAELGRIALAAPTPPLTAWRERIRATIGTETWPAALIVTAVDAEDGAARTFDAASGVPLVDAVAASCTLPGWFPPIPFDGRHWVDGGLRSTSNADLAGLADVIVAIAPFRTDGVSRRRLDAELEPARAAGARILVILPDPAFLESSRGRMMDPSLVAGAGATGIADGRNAGAEARTLLDRSHR
jgi:NTE family protein